MLVTFAHGRSQLPLDQSDVQILTTGSVATATELYIAIAGENPAGLNLLSPIVGPVSIGLGQSLQVTLSNAVRLSGEWWTNFVIAASTSNDKTTFVQIGKIPGYTVGGDLIGLPKSIVFQNDSQIYLSNIVATPANLPATPVHGALCGITSLNAVFEYNFYDSSIADNVNTIAATTGNWQKIGTSFSAYIASTSQSGGCAQDVSTLSSRSFHPPKYAADRSRGADMKFWLNNNQTNSIARGTRVGLLVQQNSDNATDLFNGLLSLVFCGYVNTSTGVLRTTASDGTAFDQINQEILFQSRKSNLILPDDLLAGEAYVLDVYPQFSQADIQSLVSGEVIKVLPFFYQDAGNYSESGEIVGNVIYAESQRRLVVSGSSTSVLVLPGSGMVDSYSFLDSPSTTISGFATNTENQPISINGNGSVRKATLPLGKTEALRAVVGTTDGIGFPGPWSPSAVVTASSSITVACSYPATSSGAGTIRANYPDIKIASNSNGGFNPTTVTIYLQRISDGQIRAFSPTAVATGASQSISISRWASGTVITAIPVPANLSFGLFAPLGTALASTTGSTDFTADNYRACFAFGYTNAITSISHDEALGCILTASTTLAGLQSRSKYWAEAVTTLVNLRSVKVAEITPYQSRYVSAVGNPYRFDPSVTLADDGANCIKPDGIDVNSPGRWLLNHSSAWFNGVDAPTASVGATGDYYLATTLGDIFQKTDSLSWTKVGNIKGIKGDPGLTAKGTWDTSKSYIIGDVVTESNSSWVCLTANKAVDPRADTGTNWQILTKGINPVGVYDAAATYYSGDVVTSGFGTYLYINSIPSVGAAFTDSAKFLKLLENLLNPKGAYVSTNTYSKYDLVADSGKTYLYISPNSSVQPLTDTTKWQLFSDRGDRGDKGEAGTGASGIPINVATLGLEIDYRFDQISGTTLKDYSGKGRDATIYGSATWASPTYGTGLFFPGTGSPYVQIPAYPFFTTPFTLECLFLCANYGINWARVFDFADTLGATSNPDFFAVAQPNTAMAQALATNFTYFKNENFWTYFQLTFDGTNIRIYVNGVSVMLSAFTPRTVTKLQNYLGKSFASVDQYFTGVMASFRYYSRQLTFQELTNNITATQNNLLVKGLYITGGNAAGSGTVMGLPGAKGDKGDKGDTGAGLTNGTLLLTPQTTPPVTGSSEVAVFVDSADYQLKRREPSNGLVSLVGGGGGNSSVISVPAVAQGLLAEYRFDQGSGTQLTDYSGNNLHGTLSNPAPTWIDWADAGLNFTPNQFVTLPAITTVADEITIEGFIYMRSYPAYGRLLELSNNPYDNALVLAVTGSGGGGLYYGNYTVSGAPSVDAPIPLDLNRWHYIQVVQKGTTATVFIDLQKVAQASNLSAIAAVTRTKNYISASVFNSTLGFLDAIVPLLRIYNKALSRDERIQNYNASVDLLSSKALYTGFSKLSYFFNSHRSIS